MLHLLCHSHIAVLIWKFVRISFSGHVVYDIVSGSATCDSIEMPRKFYYQQQIGPLSSHSADNVQNDE